MKSDYHKKLLIVGTVPDDSIPVVYGEMHIDGDELVVDNYRFEINRGTCALASAACKICETYNIPMPYALFAGDTGSSAGSRQIYNWLIESSEVTEIDIITFHYIQPIVSFHNSVRKRILSLKAQPLLIADAGYMYVAKMSGFAKDYDLFTPDIGELNFLADPETPHPFYTRGFIIHDETDIEKKIGRAYEHGNASKTMIVKGKTDYIVSEGQIVEKVTNPEVANLEPIGGTGDTVTGIASALISSGLNIVEASIKASKINRIAGKLAKPTPATQVNQIIERIPESIQEDVQ